jgi:hypothetical protein
MKSIKTMSQAELAAYIQGAFRKKGVDIVLTGGAVVALYSKGKYVSLDLDFVERGFASSRQIKAAMQALGFKQKGHHFVHAGSKYFVEFVAPPLSIGNEPVEKLAAIRLTTGTLRTLTATDCVKDRLAAFYHWNDKQSLEQALLISRAQKIKMREVQRWSRAEKMLDKYREFEAAVKNRS